VVVVVVVVAVEVEYSDAYTLERSAIATALDAADGKHLIIVLLSWCGEVSLGGKQSSAWL